LIYASGMSEQPNRLEALEPSESGEDESEAPLDPREATPSDLPGKLAAGAQPAMPRRRGRRRRPVPLPPAAGAPGPEGAVLRARHLLERLIATAGCGWREIDRRVGKNRGFTAHLLTKREGLPLGEALAILEAIDIPPEDFFEVLFPRADPSRGRKVAAADVADLLTESGVPELPAEAQIEPEAHARTVWSELDKITALIDQRVLALLAKALAEPVKLPARPEGMEGDRGDGAAEAERPAGAAGAAKGGQPGG